MNDLEDRSAGVLLGLAAGDRIGGPIRMALRVAGSLLESKGFDADDIGRRYLAWWREGAFDTGPTGARVLSLVASGRSYEQASVRVDEEVGGMTAGCNPAHRIAPLAMCASIDDDRLGAYAMTEARLTHRHPLAGDVAAAVARLCRALIRGVPWPEALTKAAEGRRPETRGSLETGSSVALSRTGFAPDVLAAAIHFLGTSASFEEALERSLDFAGPSNYCPVLVGSIGGARWGRRGIEPPRGRHHGDNLCERVTAVAEALAEGWRYPEPSTDDV
ncbi:ADP-ribosylglycohydrolase family protein [Rhodocaloribacter sp.]